MSDQVLIKRLQNCFGRSERFIKRYSVLTWLTKQSPVGPSGLTQFDEIPMHDYDFTFAPVMDDTITDQLLDKIIAEKNIKIEDSTNFSPMKEIPLPARATEGAAGFDLQAAIDETVVIEPGQFKLIPTGLSVSMPKNLELQVRPRSGLAAKYGVTVLNSPGTIDSDYGGEIKVILMNHGNTGFWIQRGDRIAQGVFNIVAIPTLKEVDILEKTSRGANGFGSTGVK